MLCFGLSKLYDKMFQLQHNIVFSMVNGRRSMVNGRRSQRAWLRPGRGRTSARKFAGQVFGWPGGRDFGFPGFRNSGPPPVPSPPFSSLARQRPPLVTCHLSLRAPARLGARLRPGRARRTQKGHSKGTPCARPRRSAAPDNRWSIVNGATTETAFRTVQRGRVGLRPQQG